ncbi:hypothetical protein ACHAXR_003559, partial [Thalassiosira sp. AJA248-18]
MDTLGSTTLNPLAKSSKGYELLITAHPMYSLTEPDTTYNVAVELGTSTHVNLVKESSDADRAVVGRVPVTDGVPYAHSFGLSRNYAVIVLQPLRLNYDMKELVEKGFLRAMEDIWSEGGGTRVVVMSLEDGSVVLDQTVDEPIYFYHSISTAELDDDHTTVSLRLCAYHEADQLTGEHQFMRLEQAKQGKDWRNKLHPGGQFCDVICDIKKDTVQVKWHQFKTKTPPQGFELPTTRYSRQRAGTSTETIDDHPRYVYAFGAYANGSTEYDNWGLFKFDTTKWTYTSYQQPSRYLSEPIFVPNPNGKKEDEDDGVLLSQMYDGIRRETALLVLDSQTMKVLAEVWTNQQSPMDFHGAWIP